MNKALIYNQSKDEWYTPPIIWEYIVNVMRLSIDLDPATTDKQAAKIGVKNHFTVWDNGLKHDWFGGVFINPPFSNKNEWIDKALSEIKKDIVRGIVMLLPMSFETQAFRKLFNYGVEIHIPNRRIKFENGNGKTPPFGSCLVYIAKQPKENKIITFDIPKGVM